MIALMSHILLIECLISSILVGLIWTIQLIHYPSFYYIRAHDFQRFESFHCSRISFIVVPLMLTEVVMALYNILFHFSLLRLSVLLLIAFIWCITFFVSVPCHDKLATGYDEYTVGRLISTNWYRTVAWSLKFIILGVNIVTLSN